MRKRKNAAGSAGCWRSRSGWRRQLTTMIRSLGKTSQISPMPPTVFQYSDAWHGIRNIKDSRRETWTRRRRECSESRDARCFVDVDVVDVRRQGKVTRSCVSYGDGDATEPYAGALTAEAPSEEASVWPISCMPCYSVLAPNKQLFLRDRSSLARRESLSMADAAGQGGHSTTTGCVARQRGRATERQKGDEAMRC